MNSNLGLLSTLQFEKKVGEEWYSSHIVLWKPTYFTPSIDCLHHCNTLSITTPLLLFSWIWVPLITAYCFRAASKRSFKRLIFYDFLFKKCAFKSTETLLPELRLIVPRIVPTNHGPKIRATFGWKDNFSYLFRAFNSTSKYIHCVGYL